MDKLLATREELLEKAIDLGLPVSGKENEETLKKYIEWAYEDNDFLEIADDDFIDRLEEELGEKPKKSITGKIASFLFIF